MSASNWTTCPRCVSEDHKRVGAAIAEIEDAYGKVSAAEYQELLKSAPDYAQRAPALREDYKIFGADTGIVSFRYSCECMNCGLSYTYNDEHMFYDPRRA